MPPHTQAGSVLPSLLCCGMNWEDIVEMCLCKLLLYSCPLIFQLLFVSHLYHSSSWFSLVLLIHGGSFFILIVPVSKLLKGNTRKLILLTSNTEYHGLGTVVTTLMPQCLVMSSVAEVESSLDSHIDANFP